jgi:short-subunit dehydrogenase
MNIVITGATKGIGRAVAEKFASEGCQIAVCARSAKDLEELKAAFGNAWPDVEVLTMPVDVRRKEELAAFAKFIIAHWEKVDALVNNAGIFIPGAIHEEVDGNLEKLIETNLYSAYYLTRALLPRMLPYRSGHIFNICSIASITPYPNGGSYSISKYALLGFSKCLREELKEKGIRVTAILPGATWSDSWRGVELPEDRLMLASDIALAVWSAWQMSPSAVVEDIVLRPQLGDL